MTCFAYSETQRLQVMVFYSDKCGSRFLPFGFSGENTMLGQKPLAVRPEKQIRHLFFSAKLSCRCLKQVGIVFPDGLENSRGSQ
jgi:hypothetical protein